jgi:acyl carrier protein
VRYLAEIADLLREVTGEDAAWQAGIRPDSRLDSDLRLESVEVAALDVALRRRYGDAVDLGGFVAGLSIDQLIGLTVADVANYVARVAP